jgi:gliding motility-associated-like protein
MCISSIFFAFKRYYIQYLSCQNTQIMKKLFLLTAILLNTIGFSQPITVSSTSHNVPQLVNNILINSPCVSATNITWSTGSNFGSSNGIGFFQNSNPNFPMQSGVVLSTGSAINTLGPNSSILNDGSSAWPGDSNLEATLAAAGITMVSKNATVLEFDFTPISPNFSFDFIFASEEYGNFQCQYSDAFAFLLTDMNTGVTKNLAVVPNTNTPISVVTIRDFLYNSSCPSVNSQYFGSFNGGSNAANSATNFNGQTRVLTAASNLTPGVPYHIKLVIADRSDPQSDSAIFISSDSFNIGQDVLGLDMSTTTNTALCFGSTHTLDTGLNATNYSFEWKKDGVTLAGENGPTLSINQAGNYSVTYLNLFSTCLPITDTIEVEYYPEIASQNPNPIYRCDSGAATYTFNLDINTSTVKQGLNPATTVSYFASQIDAENNTNLLPVQYNSAPGQTVFVRVQLPNSSCYTIKSFQLLTSPPPVANQPTDIYSCMRSTNQQYQYINLTLQNPLILNGQSSTINIISYYTSLVNANSGTNPITNASNTVLYNTTIYARVENITDPACFSITSFKIILNPRPIVDTLQNVFICTSYTLPGLTNGNYFTGPNGSGTPMSAGDVITESQTIFIFSQPGGPNTCSSNSSFTVTIVDVSSMTPPNVDNCGSYTLPPLEYGNYRTASGGAGTEITAGTVISTSQTIYYYLVTTTTPPCTVDSSFSVNIKPTIEVGSRNDVFECSSYTLPPLTKGRYFTQPGGNGDIPAGTVITTSQTIYVYAETTGTSPCSDEDSFEVIIGINQPPNISQCNGYTLPALPIGNYYTGPMGSGTQIAASTVINSSTTIYIYAPLTSGSGVNCTDNMFFTLSIAQPQIDTLNDVSVCESYTLPTLTNGEYYTGAEGTGTRLYDGDVIIASQTIYIFKRLDSTCYNQISFNVNILGNPQIDSRSDIDICDQYELTELNYGNYFTGPNGTGTLLQAGTIITTSQKIYIYASSNTTPPCYTENSFQINIFSTTADTLANVVTCDSYVLPNLTTTNKYYTQSGGPNGSGVEILPGTVITSSQTIYIFKESLIRTAFSCIDENSFTVTINNTPIIPAIADVKTCESYTLSPLSVGNYYTGPNGTGNLLNAGDVLTASQKIYVYAHTATTPDCSNEISFTVTIFNVNSLPNVTICESYTLPSLTVGNYYSNPNGLGPIINAGTVISSTQTIYIYAVSSFSPTCSDETSFTVTIIDTPIANFVSEKLRTVCDEDGANDGITSFDLTTISTTVLGAQTGNEFSIAYFESLAEATNQSNPITSTLLHTVYVRVNNSLAPNCYDIKPITIIVNKLPEPNTVDGIICIDSETGTLLNPYTITSGLNNSLHNFVWTNEAGLIVGTSSSYQATAPGIYTLSVTRTSTGCSNSVTITVSPSEPAVVTYTVEDDFADQQSIIVTATGQGNNFEYQLDNGSFQDSNVFENVYSGVHMITVRDKNGCGSTSIKAIVVNYPKFFTPNGDGYNDTWNIKDLSNQPSASILIFDRYGKVLTQIKPSNTGWDGTLNGTSLPSDDYWFSVTYKDENHVEQEFKAHFAMKR